MSDYTKQWIADVPSVDYLFWLETKLERVEAENQRLREFICHHGGLIAEWANEHKTGTLTEYIEHKLNLWLEEDE